MTYEIMTYGSERKFEEGDSVIRAVPRLDRDGGITEVVVTHMNGERQALERLIVDIRGRYKGALYSTWEIGNQ
jgi:hypothetical protein